MDTIDALCDVGDKFDRGDVSSRKKCFLCLSEASVESLRECELRQRSTTRQELRISTKRQSTRIGSRKLHILLKYLLHSCHDEQDRVECHRQLIDKILSSVLMNPVTGHDEPGNTSICRKCEKKIENLAALHEKLENVQRKLTARLNSLKCIITADLKVEEEEEQSYLSGSEEDVTAVHLELKREVTESSHRDVGAGPCIYLQKCALNPILESQDPGDFGEDDFTGGDHEEEEQERIDNSENFPVPVVKVEAVDTDIGSDDNEGGFDEDYLPLPLPQAETTDFDDEEDPSQNSQLRKSRRQMAMAQKKETFHSNIESSGEAVDNHVPFPQLEHDKDKGGTKQKTKLRTPRQVKRKGNKRVISSKVTRKKPMSPAKPDGRKGCKRIPNILPPWITHIHVVVDETKQRKKRSTKAVKKNRNYNTAYIFECITCPSFKTTNVFQFIHHLRSLHETDEKSFPCREPDCSETFRCQQMYDYHTIVEHNPLNTRKILFWRCMHCKELLPPSKFASHQKTHKDQVYECPHCFYSATAIEDHVRHQRDHKGLPQKCLFCALIFEKRAEWILHMHTDHNCANLIHTCPTCDKKFQSKLALDTHIGIHDAAIPCPFAPACKTQFSDKTHLKSHLKIVHEKQRSLRCDAADDCSEVFRDRTQLEKHQILVHNFPMYKCELCPGKEYHTSGTLRKHQQRVHNPLTHHCGICAKSFRCASALTRHEQTHGPKTLFCDKCPFTAATRQRLQAHQVIHNEIARLPCPHCPKRFNYPRALNDHIRTHTGEKPYICQYCSFAFAKEQAMTNHIRNIHENPGGSATPRKRPRVSRQKAFETQLSDVSVGSQEALLNFGADGGGGEGHSRLIPSGTSFPLGLDTNLKWDEESVPGPEKSENVSSW